MLREFSEGFVHNMGELLASCAEHNTDTVDVHITTQSGYGLTIKITFILDEDGEHNGNSI